MHVGTAPISWGVEMPRWGEELPYERVLDEMAAAGYAGTELGPWGYLPADVDRLRQELARRKLRLIGGFCPVTLHQPARLDEQRRFALDVARRLRDLGAEVLVLAEGGDAVRFAQAGHVVPGVTPAFDEDDWRRFADGVNALAAEARGIGLTAAVHAHVGTYVETEAEAERLLALTDPALVGLCVDTGHLAYAGADPVALAVRHRDRIRHVHLKDVDGDVLAQARAAGWSFAEAVSHDIFVPLGAGIVALPAMLEALRAAQYDGWLVVEQDTQIRRPEDAARPFEHARQSRETLRRLGV